MDEYVVGLVKVLVNGFMNLQVVGIITGDQMGGQMEGWMDTM